MLREKETRHPKKVKEKQFFGQVDMQRYIPHKRLRGCKPSQTRCREQRLEPSLGLQQSLPQIVPIWAHDKMVGLGVKPHGHQIDNF
jgi:hypothetical protein